jgi:glucokinase
MTARMFISAYGSFAGNVALQILPYGGFFIAGGVAAKMLPFFKEVGLFTLLIVSLFIITSKCRRVFAF